MTSDFDAINASLAAVCTEVSSSLDLGAHLLPVRTVGVQGDGRSYSYLCGITLACEPTGGQWEQLLQLAKVIPGRVHQVNRVVFLLGPKLASSPTAITPTRLTPEPIEQLRRADHVVNTVLTKYHLLRSLAQVPVTLFPVGFDVDGGRSVGIRAFITRDFMTGTPALPGRDLPIAAIEEMRAGVLAIPGIARVALDISPKPPATTEWE